MKGRLCLQGLMVVVAHGHAARCWGGANAKEPRRMILFHSMKLIMRLGADGKARKSEQ